MAPLFGVLSVRLGMQTANVCGLCVGTDHASDALNTTYCCLHQQRQCSLDVEGAHDEQTDDLKNGSKCFHGLAVAPTLHIMLLKPMRRLRVYRLLQNLRVQQLQNTCPMHARTRTLQSHELVLVLVHARSHSSWQSIESSYHLPLPLPLSLSLLLPLPSAPAPASGLVFGK